MELGGPRDQGVLRIGPYRVSPPDPAGQIGPVLWSQPSVKVADQRLFLDQMVALDPVRFPPEELGKAAHMDATLLPMHFEEEGRVPLELGGVRVLARAPVRQLARRRRPRLAESRSDLVLVREMDLHKEATVYVQGAFQT